MSDLSKKYQEILEGLEKNVQDKNELNLLKSQLSELVVYFTDMISKTNDMEENIGKVDRNIRRLSRRLDIIEEDIYVDPEEDTLEQLGSDQMHDNDFEFEITCPYCNYEFITDNSFKNEKAIKCPKCLKTIELDWGNDETSYGREEINKDSVAEDEADYKVEVNPPTDEDIEDENKNDDDM